MVGASVAGVLVSRVAETHALCAVSPPEIVGHHLVCVGLTGGNIVVGYQLNKVG